MDGVVFVVGMGHQQMGSAAPLLQPVNETSMDAAKRQYRIPLLFFMFLSPVIYWN